MCERDVNVDQHPIAVDIADLETTDLRCPQSCAIGNAQSGTIFEPRAWGRCQHLRDLFDTQNTRQPAWLRPELHVALHILSVAGRAEQKPQRHDPRVERWWRHLRIGHVKLICAQIVRRRRIRRPLQKSSKVLDCPNVGFLRLVTHPVDTHVFHHPLT